MYFIKNNPKLPLRAPLIKSQAPCQASILIGEIEVGKINLLGLPLTPGSRVHNREWFCPQGTPDNVWRHWLSHWGGRGGRESGRLLSILQGTGPPPGKSRSHSSCAQSLAEKPHPHHPVPAECRVREILAGMTPAPGSPCPLLLALQSLMCSPGKAQTCALGRQMASRS